MSSNNKPDITITPEKVVVARFSDKSERSKFRRMNKQDRLDFINWLFDHLDDVDQSQTRWKVAKELTKLYKEEHSFQLNVDWVNALLKCGIVKYGDGTYGFENENVTFTVDDMCSNASIFRSIKW